MSISDDILMDSSTTTVMPKYANHFHRLTCDGKILFSVLCKIEKYLHLLPLQLVPLYVFLKS